MKFSLYYGFEDLIRTFGPEYAVIFSKHQGCSGVEMLYDAKTYTNAVLMRLIQSLQENRLKVACVSCFADLTDCGWEKSKNDLQSAIIVAKKAGSPYLMHTISPEFNPARVRNISGEETERIFHRCEQVAEMVNRAGMKILYEPQGLHFNGLEGMLHLFNRLSQYRPGLCLDCGNSYFVDESAEQLLDALPDRIFHVHVKEYGEGNVYQSSGGKSFAEVTPKYDYYRRLNNLGYEGFFSIESSLLTDSALRKWIYGIEKPFV